jgi:hypothetical protein
VSRSRIIALQGAVVGVLLVVVYFTILRPSDDGSVSGVKVPAAPPTEVATKPPHHQPHEARPPRQNRTQARRAGVSAAAPTGVAGGAPTGLVPSTASTPTSTPVGGGPGGESPSDDQYDDMLAKLNAALR